MYLEIDAAVKFFMKILSLKNTLTADQLDSLGENLAFLLRDRYEGHWYPDKPAQGQAYRCIRINRWQHVDESLLQACQRCGLEYSRLPLPREITIWIDPFEVCGRIGETRDYFTIAMFNSVYEEPEHVNEEPVCSEEPVLVCPEHVTEEPVEQVYEEPVPVSPEQVYEEPVEHVTEEPLLVCPEHVHEEPLPASPEHVHEEPLPAGRVHVTEEPVYVSPEHVTEKPVPVCPEQVNEEPVPVPEEPVPASPEQMNEEPVEHVTEEPLLACPEQVNEEPVHISTEHVTEEPVEHVNEEPVPAGPEHVNEEPISVFPEVLVGPEQVNEEPVHVSPEHVTEKPVEHGNEEPLPASPGQVNEEPVTVYLECETSDYSSDGPSSESEFVSENSSDEETGEEIKKFEKVVIPPTCTSPDDAIDSPSSKPGTPVSELLATDQETDESGAQETTYM